MGYASESKNKRWGLPVGIALILIMVLIWTAGAPATAMAATISCGQCHGAYLNNTDGTKSLLPGISSTEDVKTPQDQDICNDVGMLGRGLHGVHMNYSSATYGRAWDAYKAGGAGLSDTRGSCSLCHNKHVHENAYVEFSGMAYTDARSNMKVSSKVAVTGAGMGPNGMDISLLNGTATCTAACHKGTSATNTAPWGNYTSSSIKLSCVSCHDDSSTASTSALSGNHKNHLLSNCTTPAGVLMSGSSNIGCQACHPDNRADLWKNGRADNGTAKAYPHATDGTNVVSDNVVLTGQITSAAKAGLGTTCANNCHPRSATITWSGSLDCNMCHYYGSPTLDTNNTGTGALSAGHNPHFKSGNQFACTECHPSHADANHASRLPAAGYNVTVARAGMTYDSVAKTCNNTGGTCHGAGTTPSFTGPFNNGCAACHYYPGAPARDWSVGNGHKVRFDAPVVNTHMRATTYFHYSSASETFASAVADTGKCGLCHRNTKHRNGSGFAHLSSATSSAYSECGTTPFTFSVGGVGGGSSDNVTCSNVRCHSGKTTPVWW